MRRARAGTFSGCGVGVLRLLLARTPRVSAMMKLTDARRFAVNCAPLWSLIDE
jgi:16S rRNA G1207 methylase RsmC